MNSVTFLRFNAGAGPKEGWIDEGLAVCYDRSWNGRDLDSLAKQLKSEGRLIPLARLLKHPYNDDPMIAYPELGSFTGYLLENFDRPLLRVMETGIDRPAAAVRKEIKEFEKDWIDHLD